MLILPIKKQWFDMIEEGIKKEEYREIKSYYTTRFKNIIGEENMQKVNKGEKIPLGYVLFKNGYSKNSPSFVAHCSIHIGTGKSEWGAESDVQYYVLTINDQKKTILCSNI